MIARIRRIALSAVVTLLAAGIAAPLAAQGVAQPSTDTERSGQHRVAPAGPSVDRAAVGARRAMQPAGPAELEAATQPRLGLGRARALMIVGFAAVIIGLVVGGDPGTLIAIGGAAVGLYGLYHYLR